MAKKVAIQEDLYELRRELENMGYVIVNLDEDNVEAIVYTTSGDEIPYLTNSISMSVGSDMDFGRGAVLINAKGKDAYEIDRIIKNRIYTPLF